MPTSDPALRKDCVTISEPLPYNELVVLEALEEPISRREVAESVDVSYPTVCRTVNSLKEKGLVGEINDPDKYGRSLKLVRSADAIKIEL